MISMTPEQRQIFRWEREIDERNRPLTDDELDAIMPKEGYKVTYADLTTLLILATVKYGLSFCGFIYRIPQKKSFHMQKLAVKDNNLRCDKCCLFQVLDPPPGYQPLRTPSRKLTATPTPMGLSGFTMQV